MYEILGNLLIRDYQPIKPEETKNLERYMCSRFFIDFSELPAQKAKLESYLQNHFIGDDYTKTRYLVQLYNVVDNSTVCLMGHERRQTLSLIQDLGYHFYLRHLRNSQQQQQQQQQTHHYPLHFSHPHHTHHLNFRAHHAHPYEMSNVIVATSQQQQTKSNQTTSNSKTNTSKGNNINTAISTNSPSNQLNNANQQSNHHHSNNHSLTNSNSKNNKQQQYHHAYLFGNTNPNSFYYSPYHHYHHNHNGCFNCQCGGVYVGCA